MQQHPFGAVSRPNAHPIFRAQPQACQAARHLFGLLGELRERQPDALMPHHQRFVIRKPISRLLEHFPDRFLQERHVRPF